MLKREYSQNFHANRAIEAVLKFCEMNEIAVNIANFQWKEFFAIKEAEHQLEEIDIRTLGVSDQIEILNLHNELILQSYYSYFKDTFSATNPLIKGRHIELLCDLLTLAVMGLIKTGGHGTNIVINMPPRHLKSTTITNAFPSWFMLKTQKSVIVTTYGDSLAEKSGALNRDLYDRYHTLFGVNPINPSQKSKAVWSILGGGRFIGSPIDGKVTGEGADLLIIDDPVKNRKDANSLIRRERIKEAWEDDLRTRRHPGNPITLIVMTRWHEADLAGIVLADTSEKFASLVLKAEHDSEENDVLGRKNGELLWNEGGFNTDYFKPFKMNKRTWASLYQQSPTVEEGDHFKQQYFKYFEVNQSNGIISLFEEDGSISERNLRTCHKFITVDSAMKEGNQNDETVISVWLETEQLELLLLDSMHQRLSIPKQVALLRSIIIREKPYATYIEDKQGGTFLVQKLREEGFAIEELAGDTDKILRAEASVNLYENGKIYHNMNLFDLQYLEKQLLVFPNGSHDDFVDTVSYAGKLYMNKNYSDIHHFIYGNSRT